MSFRDATLADAGALRDLEREANLVGRAALERAVRAIRGGGRVPRLWRLADNDRALGLYRHLGWTSTGVEQRSEWTPYPVERELVLLEGSADG